LDNIDLTKYMHTVNTDKILTGHVSLTVENNTIQGHDPMAAPDQATAEGQIQMPVVQFHRQFDDETYDFRYPCPFLIDHDIEKGLSVSMLATMKAIKDISTRIQAAHVKELTEQGVAGLLTRMTNDPSTAAGADSLRKIKLGSGPFFMDQNVESVFRKYAIQLLEITDHQVFNSTMQNLVEMADQNPGMNAFLEYLDEVMKADPASGGTAPAAQALQATAPAVAPASAPASATATGTVIISPTEAPFPKIDHRDKRPSDILAESGAS